MLDSLDTLIAFVLIMLVVSLLITIVVQMVGAALNLRGRNVAKGLRQSLNAILPGFDVMGKQFADHILTGPLLSDSSMKWLPKFWRRASAVRPDEVFDSIHRMAIGRKGASSEMQRNAQCLLVALGFDPKTLLGAAGKVTASATAARALGAPGKAGGAPAAMADPAEPPEAVAAQKALEQVAAQLRAVAAPQIERAAAGAEAAASTVDQAYKQFQYWFEIGQERAGQWFTVHTRICTIVLAFIFAFWLQLDTVEIFKMVSTNRVVRDKLVAQATSVTSQAERIIGDGSNLLQEALKTWVKALPEGDVRQAVASVEAFPTDTRGTLRKRVEEALDTAGIQSKSGVLDAFDKTVDEVAQKKLDEGAKDYGALKRSLDKTGFDLFVNNKLGRWGHGWWDDLCPHFLGMLFSAALLSLGAPFWYNALKGLTSLRSTVAQNMSKEKGEQKPAPEKAKSAPPTV
jgi:hypothetical protein